jgi:hypothetical protein
LERKFGCYPASFYKKQGKRVKKAGKTALFPIIRLHILSKQTLFHGKMRSLKPPESIFIKMQKKLASK